MLKKISLYAFIVLHVMLFGCSTSRGGNNSAIKADVRYVKLKGETYVYLRDVAKYYSMKYVPLKATAELKSKYSRLIFRYKKKQGIINGVKVFFFHSPIYERGNAFISKNDFLYFVDPILQSRSLRKSKAKVVILDPGHGKPDDGGKGKRYKEKDIVLKVAKKLSAELKKRGYTVYLTRYSDRFVKLKGRSVYAKKYKGDLFISLHTNIAGSSAARGLETYCLTPMGTTSTNGGNAKKKSVAGDRYIRNSVRLAHAVQKRLVKGTQGNDRALRHAQFAVLKYTDCPSILIEMGFLSNNREEWLLGRDSYQAILVKAIADGIDSYKKAVK
jgi:N-acetylmuramoyl-L-alanine amidase